VAAGDGGLEFVICRVPIDKARKASTKELAHRQHRSRIEMQDLAGYPVGIDNIPTSLNENVAGQSFKKRLLLGRKYGDISFGTHI
jgi:hypothetical protein